MSNGARDLVFQRWVSAASPTLDHGKVPDRSRYTEINKGGDRHGALEWSYGTKPSDDDPLTRMVGVGIIPEADGNAATVEFWFGARHDDRYMRRPVSAILFGMDDDWGVVEQNLAEAQEAADGIQEADLTQLVPALLWPS
ncbi:hypothetical protein ACH4TC_18665 [Streptomyces spororaveus]|uniref:hypothetical protein n=1 Tax=Streptomyces spororaveus TaxID=284039 RepID=UPI00379C725A